MDEIGLRLNNKLYKLSSKYKYFLSGSPDNPDKPFLFFVNFFNFPLIINLHVSTFTSIYIHVSIIIILFKKTAGHPCVPTLNNVTDIINR